MLKVRQEYESSLNVLQIPVDDTSSTNIIVHFPQSNQFIHDALARNERVFVHCQAGVSRSTTLVAAFLMAEFGLDVERAVEKVRNVRSQVEPTEFFLHQLEMFERCECEWDPVKVRFKLACRLKKVGADPPAVGRAKAILDELRASSDHGSGHLVTCVKLQLIEF